MSFFSIGEGAQIILFRAYNNAQHSLGGGGGQKQNCNFRSFKLKINLVLVFIPLFCQQKTWLPCVLLQYRCGSP